MSQLLHEPPFDDSILCQACTVGRQVEPCHVDSCPCTCKVWDHNGTISWDKDGRVMFARWDVEEIEVANSNGDVILTAEVAVQPFDANWSEVHRYQSQSHIGKIVPTLQTDTSTPWKAILAVLLCANLVVMGILVYLVGR